MKAVASLLTIRLFPVPTQPALDDAIASYVRNAAAIAKGLHPMEKVDQLSPFHKSAIKSSVGGRLRL